MPAGSSAPATPATRMLRNASRGLPCAWPPCPNAAVARNVSKLLRRIGRLFRGEWRVALHTRAPQTGEWASAGSVAARELYPPLSWPMHSLVGERKRARAAVGCRVGGKGRGAKMVWYVGESLTNTHTTGMGGGKGCGCRGRTEVDDGGDPAVVGDGSRHLDARIEKGAEPHGGVWRGCAACLAWVVCEQN